MKMELVCVRKNVHNKFLYRTFSSQMLKALKSHSSQKFHESVRMMRHCKRFRCIKIWKCYIFFQSEALIKLYNVTNSKHNRIFCGICKHVRQRYWMKFNEKFKPPTRVFIIHISILNHNVRINLDGFQISTHVSKLGIILVSDCVCFW